MHGFVRTHRDMGFLAAGLAEAGYRVHAARLPSFLGSVAGCATALERQLAALDAGGGPVHVLAHSMGGLVVREALRHTGAGRIGRCVFIATPHWGSRLADIAVRVPGLSRLAPCLPDLTARRRVRLTRLPAGVELGLIAGSRNNLLLGRLLLSGHSDGRVEVASVRTDDAQEMIVLPFGHNDIHKRRRTLEAVERFLRTGRFQPSRPCEA